MKQIPHPNVKDINYANQNTKYPSTPTKIPSTPTENLRCFVARKFLSQIYALFWCTFYAPKNMVVYQK